MTVDPASDRPPPDAVPGEFGPACVLVERADAIVFLGGIRVWRTGFSFVVTISLAAPMAQYDGFAAIDWRGHTLPDREDDIVEVTVTVPAGTRYSNRWRNGDPLLQCIGGGGSPTWQEGRFWPSPLPPGPHVEVCVAWPTQGLSGSARLATDGFAEAAARSRPVRWATPGGRAIAPGSSESTFR